MYAPSDNVMPLDSLAGRKSGQARGLKTIESFHTHGVLPVGEPKERD